jgi:predicted secreted protein
VAAIAIVVAATGCGSDSSSSSATVRESGTASSVKMKEGENLALTFDVQPGVGFEWTLTSNRPGGFLEHTGGKESANESGAIGGPATRTFVFHAEKPGSAALRFHHSYRGKPRGDHTVRVTVSGD